MRHIDDRALSPTAKAALRDVLAAVGGFAAFDGLPEDHARVHGYVLQLFADKAGAPSTTELGTAAGFSEAQIKAALTDLEDRDLLILRDGEVNGAYPFTASDTGITVQYGEKPVSAMCAVDALGIGAMLRRSSTIRSSCVQCRTAVTVETSAAGRELRSAEPPEVVVWLASRKSGPAATSLCAVTRFACGPAHLDTWLRSRGGMEGYALSLQDALALGCAFFGDLIQQQPLNPDPGTEVR